MQSPRIGAAMLDLRSFSFEKVYLDSRANEDSIDLAGRTPRLVRVYPDPPDHRPRHERPRQHGLTCRQRSR